MMLATQEYFVGRYIVRIAASQADLPGVEGWLGTWAIYRLPLRPGEPPIRFGDTDFQNNESVALGMARTIGLAIARSL